MERWSKISLMLCVFGFLKEFRPSDHFIFEFMSGPWTEMSQEEVFQRITPVGTYSYLLNLLLVFLVTDLLRYKALIVINGLCGMISWSMLISTNTLFPFQVSEAFFGVFMSCEVAYYTYIYAKVEEENCLQVSSHTRAAVLAGAASSGILSQVLISWKLMNYKELIYITFGAMVLATCWSLFLPSVDESIYFHQKDGAKITICAKAKAASKLMKAHFRQSFYDRYVLKWSLWWALSTAGYIQVQLYLQPLWVEIIAKQKDAQLYNGAVEAAATLLGFLGAVSAGYCTVDWKDNGEIILSLYAIIAGGLNVLSSQTQYVWVSYVCYALYCICYQFMITIASSEVAKGIVDDSYGLVFGINTFVALALQTIITLTFVDGRGLALAPRSQHLVYGIYHFLIASIFIIIALASLFRKRSKRNVIKNMNENISEPMESLLMS